MIKKYCTRKTKSLIIHLHYFWMMYTEKDTCLPKE